MKYSTIAESNQFIVLDEYKKITGVNEIPIGYQTEADLEKELVQDLVQQGYEHLPQLSNQERMLANVRVQLQNLNQMQFTDSEWQRFVVEYLDKHLPTHYDLQQLRADLAAGWYLASDIPVGYGLGSSAALCVAVFERYATEEGKAALQCV